MLIASILLSTMGQTALPATSAAFRSQARPALAAAVFSPGTPIVDERGTSVGKVVSVEQGLVTVKTARSLLRMPTSAFTIRGGSIVLGLSAAQVDVLAHAGFPTK